MVPMYVIPYSRVVSSDVAAAEGVVSLMKRFDWMRVAVVTQQETIFTSVRCLSALTNKLSMIMMYTVQHV